MMRAVVLSAVVGLAACAPQSNIRELSDPSVNALMAQPVAQYYGTLAVARDVANFCNRYAYDAQLEAAITNARADSPAALAQRGGIDIETDVTTRSFEARHGVTVGQDDLCAAADAEVAAGSALSAVLRPV